MLGKSIKHWAVCAAGFWTAADGTELWFFDDDIQKMAERINELNGYLKPPLKIHHESIDLLRMPAAGWVGAGAMAHPDNEGRMTLYVDIDDIPEGIYQLIESKLLKNPSVEIKEGFEDRPGWTVTAVALLGTELPAVKGLKDPLDFKEKKDFLSMYGVDAEHLDSVAMYFEEPRGNYKSNRTLVLSSLGDEMPKKKTKEKMMELTQEQIDGMINSAVLKATDKVTLEFSDKLKTITGENADLKSKSEKQGEMLTRFQEGEVKTHADNILAFCDDLTKVKRLAPAIVKGVNAVLSQANNEKVLKFSDGKDGEVEATLFERVKTLVEDMIKLASGDKPLLIVPKGEVLPTGDVNLAGGTVDLVKQAEQDSKSHDSRGGK